MSKLSDFMDSWEAGYLVEVMEKNARMKKNTCTSSLADEMLDKTRKMRDSLQQEEAQARRIEQGENIINNVPVTSASLLV